MVVTYSPADRGSSTEAAVRIQGGAGLVFRLMAQLTAWQVRRSLRGGLRRLKQRLDGVPATAQPNSTERRGRAIRGPSTGGALGQGTAEMSRMRVVAVAALAG